VTLLTPVIFVAVALSAVAAGDVVPPGDIAVTRLIQGAPETGAGDLARIVNALGETPAMLEIGAGAALALLALGRPGGALLLLAATAARAANPALKALFDSPRPSPERVRVEEVFSGPGFPSGHVMGMVLLVGAAACLAWDAWPDRRARLTVLATAGAILLASGFGRIYVGAHWPSDVLGAYLWGGAGLIALVWSRRAGQILAPAWVDRWLGRAYRPALAAVASANVDPLAAATPDVTTVRPIGIVSSKGDTRMARDLNLRRWTGALALGALAALGVAMAAGAVAPAAQTPPQAGEYTAQIRTGACDAIDAAAAFDLGPVGVQRSDDEDGDRDDAPSGDFVGAPGAYPVAVSASRVSISLDDLLAQPYAIVVTAGAPDDPVAACGGIGGYLRDGDELIVGLAPQGGSAFSGVAFLDDDDDDDDDDDRAVEVTLYLVDASA
jgi:undecaprenyl-diphosphatase